MQQYSTHRSSNAPLRIAMVGVGALLAYALSSQRRRDALMAAGQSALDSGSRLATRSADRLRELMADRSPPWAGRLSEVADTTADATSKAADGFHDLVDRASALM